jgi:hypothetical protein
MSPSSPKSHLGDLRVLPVPVSKQEDFDDQFPNPLKAHLADLFQLLSPNPQFQYEEIIVNEKSIYFGNFSGGSLVGWVAPKKIDHAQKKAVI